MGGKVGSVFGTGRYEIYVNFVHKCCERKRNLIHVLYMENNIVEDFGK